MNPGILAVCAYIILLTGTVLWALMKAVNYKLDRLHAGQKPAGACVRVNPEAQ